MASNTTHISVNALMQPVSVLTQRYCSNIASSTPSTRVLLAFSVRSAQCFTANVAEQLQRGIDARKKATWITVRSASRHGAPFVNQKLRFYRLSRRVAGLPRVLR